MPLQIRAGETSQRGFATSASRDYKSICSDVYWIRLHNTLKNRGSVDAITPQIPPFIDRLTLHRLLDAQGDRTLAARQRFCGGVAQFRYAVLSLTPEDVAALFGVELARLVVDTSYPNSWACSEILSNEVTSNLIGLREEVLSALGD